MNQNTNQNTNNQPCFCKVIGKTTYVVQVHFSETSRETMEGMIKKLLFEETKTEIHKSI